MGLIIRSSSIHAAGCYTTSPIRRGQHVVEYTGPRISKQEADDKYENCPITYLFGIGDGEVVIDGHGVAMFINHSCDPNCETEEIEGHIWIIALRNIAAGEELTYDYQLYDGGDDGTAVCTCGTRKCRKSMYSREELRKRARVAKKLAAKQPAREVTPHQRKTRKRQSKSTPATRRR